MRNAFEVIHIWQSCAEAATGRVVEKKMFLKILQNLQEKTCARVSFLNKLNQTPT